MPTSHERTSGRSWDASYQNDDPAPWDIGRPQDAFVRIAAEGRLAGAVLDAGCGSGEHALLAASTGLPVLGVDVAPTAIELARAKAIERGIDAEFEVADAFELGRLQRSFETVLDCGLFHTCDDGERVRYVSSLASVTARDGTLFLLCFNDRAPDIGPHPVRADELHAAFDAESGWELLTLEEDRIQTTFMEAGVPAWFAAITRL
jgi:SAM-dependent methyltransferase